MSLGLIFNSYAFRWFEAGPAAWRPWRPVVTGLVFGVLTVVMMISRIQVAPDRDVDARAVPIALVRSWKAGWPAVSPPPSPSRIGSTRAAAAPPPRARVAATAAGGGGSRVGPSRWAHRPRHSLMLSAIVWVVTAVSFLSLGERGAMLFTPLWLPFLVLSLVGIGGGARLFADVVASHAVESARRDSAQLRAVTLLASAAAHEINNPLTAVMGGLGLIARRLPAGSEEQGWIKTARRARSGSATSWPA